LEKARQKRKNLKKGGFGEENVIVVLLEKNISWVWGIGFRVWITPNPIPKRVYHHLL
jgi:hypothetical protein